MGRVPLSGPGLFSFPVGAHVCRDHGKHLILCSNKPWEGRALPSMAPTEEPTSQFLPLVFLRPGFMSSLTAPGDTGQVVIPTRLSVGK